jgi:hypothetical protein
MRATITCTACGTVLGVPKSGMPRDGISCNWCGYVNLPAPEPEPKPVAAATAEVRQARHAEPTAKGAPHPWADDDDDNGQPYALPQEEVKTRPCTACGKEVDVGAVVCVHCGFDSTTKQKVERTFSPIDREWESGWPFAQRLAVYLGLQGINAFMVMLGVAVGGSLPVSIGAIVFYSAIQAFLLGTYDAVRIRRNRKGQAEITIMWRLCFIPMAPKKVNWREHEGVAVGHFDATSAVDWIMALILLPCFIIPAILWWYYIIRPDRFFAALCRDRGFPETFLYRGTSEPQAKEIAQVATDATSLPLMTPL